MLGLELIVAALIRTFACGEKLGELMDGVGTDGKPGTLVEVVFVVAGGGEIAVSVTIPGIDQAPITGRSPAEAEYW
jgi:hypothetical protein